MCVLNSHSEGYGQTLDTQNKMRTSKNCVWARLVKKIQRGNKKDAECTRVNKQQNCCGYSHAQINEEEMKCSYRHRKEMITTSTVKSFTSG